MSKFAPPSPEMVPAHWHGGAQVPGLLVMHATVGPSKAGSAAAVAHMFATETNPTSAHYVVDARDTIQCVPDHTVAYHCGYNDDTLSIEMCFMPLLSSLANWLDPAVKQHARVRLASLRPDVQPMLANAAELAAQLCLAYDIPIRYLTDDQLRAWAAGGRPARLGGVVTHAQMSRVFKESTHWDPGAWPSKLFLRRVTAAATNLKAAA